MFHTLFASSFWPAVQMYMQKGFNSGQGFSSPHGGCLWRRRGGGQRGFDLYGSDFLRSGEQHWHVTSVMTACVSGTDSSPWRVRLPETILPALLFFLTSGFLTSGVESLFASLGIPLLGSKTEPGSVPPETGPSPPPSFS